MLEKGPMGTHAQRGVDTWKTPAAPQQRLQIIETLKELPDALDALIVGAPADALRKRPSEEEWSVKEVIGHLRDLSEVWYKRLYMTWSHTDPVFPGFDGEASVKQNNYQDADLPSLLGELRKHRLEIVDLLDHAVDWSRIGQHREYGRRSLRQWAEFIAEHDAIHLDQIRTLKGEKPPRRRRS